MNRRQVDKIAQAVLYEGYVLYPYRPSVKNTVRWTFGGIYPRAWSEAQAGADAWEMRTECLVTGAEARVGVWVKFLQLRTGLEAWQEAEEREIAVGEFRLAELGNDKRRVEVEFPGEQAQRRQINGAVEVSALLVNENLFRLSVRILNETEFAGISRDEALMRSLVSTHTVLGVEEGEFVSMINPPEELRAAAAECKNMGAWPVLVGEAGQRDTMLSSPIILYDYPEIAAQSPGDLFDATEIDEILTLRILTLTDEERAAGASRDPRVAEMLSRTEALARQQLMGLHGTMRGMRHLTEESHG